MRSAIMKTLWFLIVFVISLTLKEVNSVGALVLNQSK